MNSPATEPDRISRFLPPMRSRWWSLLLILSLMFNLLIGGLFIGRQFGHWERDRLIGSSVVQVIPRKFFMDLPRERRHELLRAVREKGKGLRDLRDGTSALITDLANKLEKPDYNPDEVKAAITAISTGEESLAGRSSELVSELVSGLTPDERKLLAAAIRERASRNTRAGPN